MSSQKYYAEQNPEWKRIDQYPAPNGTKVLLRTRYGTAIIGQYYPEGEFTHWCGLPKLSKEEKEQELNAKTQTETNRQTDWVLDSAGGGC